MTNDRRIHILKVNKINYSAAILLPFAATAAFVGVLGGGVAAILLFIVNYNDSVNENLERLSNSAIA